jgi:hypothetical protein
MNNECSTTIFLSVGLRYSPKEYRKWQFLMMLAKGKKINQPGLQFESEVLQRQQGYT